MYSEVQAYLDRWIAMLRLGEYEYTLRLVRGMSELGYTKASPVYKKALIDIRDPSDGSHPDWKRTVIHEALHLRIPLSAPKGSPLCAVIETSVEMLARVLYEMDSGGAAPDAIYGKAHGWARTLETARLGQRIDRMNGKRIVEIAVALSAMQLPEEAMALVTELSGLAIEGEGGPASGVDPMAAKDPVADPAADPMAAADPAKLDEKMYRAALGDQVWTNFKANAAKMARAQLVSMARAELGDGPGALTVEDEAELLTMSPSEASAFLKGRKRASAGGMAREGLRPPPDGDGPILAPGEDPAKVNPVILKMRAQQAAQFGRATVEAGLKGRRVS